MRRLFVAPSLLALAACAQQPPPVATNPPPPPLPPPQTFTVYFDYNSAALGPGATEVVKFAADAYKAGTPSGVHLTGYTESSGAASYNQRLSLRRANAVATALENDGVPQNALVVNGEGETSNAPTAGQDRRVDIIVGGSPPAS
jgi:OmpA-OmpF porin, OOP family